MAKTKTSFKKGEAKGKPKGALNHTTRDIKEAYQLLIEKNLDNLSKWLNEIAVKDPARAINIILDLSEYVIPKLARSDFNLKNNSGEKVQILFNEICEDDFNERLERANKILEINKK